MTVRKLEARQVGDRCDWRSGFLLSASSEQLVKLDFCSVSEVSALIVGKNFLMGLFQSEQCNSSDLC